MSELGRLEKVEIRTAFATEDGVFTPWLSKEENLELLEKTLNMSLECEAIEKQVGPYRADMRCKNIDDNSWVVIENQFGKTDHDHLGKLLTYAAALEASTVVWITERFTDEHRATLDWLNEKIDGRVKFFGLEIELWRIGDSKLAPNFSIRCQPNDWTADVRSTAAKSMQESVTKQLQQRFWISFRQFMEDSKSSVKCQKPGPQHWMNHPIGKVGFHLASIISTGKGNASGVPEVRVELIIDGKQRYDAMLEHKEEVEKKIAETMYWYSPEEKNSSRVYVQNNGDFTDEANWPELQAWIKAELEKFYAVFAPIIKSMDHSALKLK